jgi:Heterokaryon incompatibility protein (HET)
MSSTRKYVYSLLPSPTSFRLLSLLPGGPDDAIEFLLFDADWKSPPHYEALSYAWGDTTEKMTTYCDGRELKITKSLHDALSHL